MFADLCDAYQQADTPERTQAALDFVLDRFVKAHEFRLSN